MENFELFPFTIDDETPRLHWREVVALARLRKLTVYDATYLELALRTGLPLATLDQDLASAARAESVQLLID
jgi:predicted nucleic acid-binding protein